MLSEFEQLVLHRFDIIDGGIHELKEEVGELRTRMDRLEMRMDCLETRMDSLETKVGHLETRMDGLETEVGSLKSVVAGIAAKQDTMGEELHNLKLLVENDISRKIDVIGEGHDFLKQHLSEALQMELKREHMELEILNLKIRVDRIEQQGKTA